MGLNKLQECYLPIIREVEHFKMRYERKCMLLDEALQLTGGTLTLLNKMQLDGMKDYVQEYHKACNFLMEILILKNPKQFSTIYDEEIL